MNDGTAPHDQDQAARDTVARIMRDTHIATLTYTDLEGRLVSAPMGTQDFDDPGTVWFITEADSDKMRAIAANPAVNVAYSSGDGWVSLSGTARLNTDTAKLKELWSAGTSVFMSGDADDPNNALLEVRGDSAQLWESPGKLRMLVTLAKGLVTDGQPMKDGKAPIIGL